MIIDGIDFVLERKKVKYLRITVKQDKIVRVSVPHKMKDKQVANFLISKIDWVKKHLERPVAKERNICSYNDGDIMYLWGSEHTLNITKGERNKCTYDDTNICISLRNIDDNTTKLRLIKKLYRTELMGKAEVHLAAWSEKTNLAPKELRIRDMKTRWGTCNIAAKRIWLSQRLALFPEFCLEYVVLHELLHLVEKNHNQKFYALLSIYLPEWKKAKARLRFGEGDKC